MADTTNENRAVVLPRSCSAQLSGSAQDAIRLICVVAESGVTITCGELREKIIRPFFGEDVHNELTLFFAPNSMDTWPGNDEANTPPLPRLPDRTGCDVRQVAQHLSS